MKNYLFIVILMGTSFLCHAQKKVILDLSEGITWTEVFEAGLRPKHLNDGTYMCAEYGVSVTLKNSKTGFQLDLGIGDIDFKLKANHQLIQILFYGRENLGIQEARSKSDEFLKMFGDAVTQKADLSTFQTKHEIDYNGQKIDPAKIVENVNLETATNAAKVGDFSVIYRFSDSYSDNLPLVERLLVTLKSQEARRARRLTEKIRPPDGYENISLEANEKTDGAGGESRITRHARQREANSQTSRKQDINRDNPSVEKSTSYWWIFGGVISLVILILLRIFKASQRKQ